jgi:hypothetical protein
MHESFITSHYRKRSTNKCSSWLPCMHAGSLYGKALSPWRTIRYVEKVVMSAAQPGSCFGDFQMGPIFLSNKDNFLIPLWNDFFVNELQFMGSLRSFTCPAPAETSATFLSFGAPHPICGVNIPTKLSLVCKVTRSPPEQHRRTDLATARPAESTAKGIKVMPVAKGAHQPD